MASFASTLRPGTPGTSTNQPPTLAITGTTDLDIAATAYLDANETDDGLGVGPLTALWDQISGPATAVYLDNTWFAPHVTFPATGVYVLQATIYDGPVGGSLTLSASDTHTVTVTNTGSNLAPTVSISGPSSVPKTSSGFFTANASDDGLPDPPATLTYVWSMKSGPGAVTFGQSTSVSSSATFDTLGTYIIQCSVSDSALATVAEKTVEVVVSNPAPAPGLPSTLVEAWGGWFPNSNRDDPSIDRTALTGVAPVFVATFVQRTGWNGWESDVANKIAKPVGNTQTHIVAIPPIIVGTTLAAAASGSFDARYQKIVDALLLLTDEQRSRLAFRWGWEFNGSWYPWEVKTDTAFRAQFAAVFRRVHDLVTAALDGIGATGRPRWVFNVAGGQLPGTVAKAALDIELSFPGAQYVDVITFDLYSNFAFSSNTSSSSGFGVGFDAATTKIIDYMEAFAQGHSKPIGIDEWSTEWKLQNGVQVGGDDYPGFASGVFAWARARIVAGDLAWLCLFDNDTTTNSFFASLNRKALNATPTIDRTGPGAYISGTTAESNFPLFAKVVIDELATP